MKFVTVLLLSVMFLWPLNSFADVTFDDATASRMVVSLEQAKITEEQLSLQAASNAELQAQVDILKGTIKLMEDQIVVYKNMAEMNQKMSDMKDRACVEQVKAAKPTFGQNMSKYLTGAAGGGVFIGLLFLLL